MKRVHLVDSNGQRDLAMVRRASIAIASYFCNGDQGWVVGDPIFEYVTEGRQSSHNKLYAQGKVKFPYFSCGDLVHTVLVFLGVRDEHLINRNMDGGVHPWEPQQNILRPQQHKSWHVFDSRSVYEGGSWFDVGDPFMTCCDPHVAIFEDIDFNKGELTSYDYGQVSAKGQAQGIRKHRTVHMEGNRLMIGNKHVVGYVSLADVDLETSAIVPDDFNEGVEDTTNPEPYILMP